MDDLLAVGALLASGFCARAYFALYRLARGKTKIWGAAVWFATALLALLVLDATSLASRMTG